MKLIFNPAKNSHCEYLGERESNSPPFPSRNATHSVAGESGRKKSSGFRPWSLKPITRNISWKLIFFLGVFMFFFLPPNDTDLGWHLKYGDYFLSQGKFLTQNKLTVLLSDYYWPNSYSLYQILSATIFRLAKFPGLSFSYALVFVTFFYLLYLILKKNICQTSFLFLVITFFSWSVFGLGWRAQIFSLLGLALIFRILKTSKKYFFLPLIFFFWANFHGGFILGIMVLAIFLLLQLIEVSTKKMAPKSVYVYCFYFLLSLMATIINPYGFKIWWEDLNHLKVPMHELIAEWLPPQGLLYFLLMLFFALAFIMFLAQKRKSLWQWFLFICLFPFFYLVLSARRNLPFFFTITGLIILSSNFAEKLVKNINFTSLGKSFIILIFLWGLFYQLPNTLLTDLSWKNYCQQKRKFPFPCEAVDFIKENKIKGTIYNTYEWGGFLEWQLPDSIFFVDGRMPAWPTSTSKSPYTIYLDIIQHQPGWEQTLESYKIDYLFIGAGTFLDLKLKNSPDKYPWQEIYRDQKAVIYEKKA